jgi:hypothetical protein
MADIAAGTGLGASGFPGARPWQPSLPVPVQRDSFQDEEMHRSPRTCRGAKEFPMKNPWTKKNPFLSMWLSGANATLGAARGRATAESRRQASDAMTKSMKQATDFWMSAWGVKPAPKRRKKRR